MPRRQAARSASISLALLAGLVLAAVGAAPAAAHDHPSQVELDAPGVVFIKTFAQVNISLIEHNRLGRHIGLVQRTYEPELASGSGFAVDPNGSIVTAGTVVSPDLKQAEIYAVNKVFSERYGKNAPLGDDLFNKQRISDLAADPINARLQRCYQPNTTDNNGGCLVSVSRVVRVFPWVSDQRKFGSLTAEVLSPAQGKTQDVAVLRIGASSMPTVALGQSASATKAFTVLGFSDVPTDKLESQAQLIGHFKAAGGLPFDEDDVLPKLKEGLAAGARGGPLVAAETGQVTGLLSLPADTTGAAAAAEPAFIDAKRIREVLSSVGVEPRRGPTDAVFEDAMHSYKNKLYTAPIPSFQRALELYPGHALATTYLATSKAKAGTAEDLTGKEGGGLADESSGAGGLPGWLPIVLAVVVVLAVLAAVLLALMRRRAGRFDSDEEEEEEDDDGQAPVLPPVGAGVGAGAGGAAAPPPPPPSGLAHNAVGKAPAPPRGSTASVARPSTVSPVPPGVQPPAAPPPAPASAPEPKPSAERAVPADDKKASQVSAAVGATGAAIASSGPMKPAATTGTNASSSAPSRDKTSATFCTQCGHRLAEQHRFCGFCGTPVG